jgi:transposase
MRTVSDEQIQRLLEGIEQGLSRTAIAKHAGVCERTAANYRRLYEENIGPLREICGCGRPLKHQGRCRYRRYTPYQVEGKKS